MPTAGWGSAHSPDRLLPQYPFGELLGQVPVRAHNTEGMRAEPHAPAQPSYPQCCGHEGMRAEQGHGAHTLGSIGEKLRERAKVIK